MKAFTEHTGKVAILDYANVDTDQIIPKQFLKSIERTGFGKFAFYDWRYLEDNVLNPKFPLNSPLYADASILLAGPNFGCGSSREHAAWALGDYGFKAIISSSFADIFRNNCFQNGILLVELPVAEMDELMANTSKLAGYSLTVDLENQTVSDGRGFTAEFSIDSFRRNCMLKGLDDIGLTLEHEDAIEAFEKSRTG